MVSNKSRLLRLYKYLYINTDSEHYTTKGEIMEALRDEETVYSRQTVRNDIDTLTEEGYDIETVVSSGNYYYFREREFSLEELRMMADAVASSRFISKREKSRIRKKLKQFCSKYQAGSVERHLICLRQPEKQDAAVYEMVNVLNDAINKGRRISFQLREPAVLLESPVRSSEESGAYEDGKSGARDPAKAESAMLLESPVRSSEESGAYEDGKSGARDSAKAESAMLLESPVRSSEESGAHEDGISSAVRPAKEEPAWPREEEEPYGESFRGRGLVLAEEGAVQICTPLDLVWDEKSFYLVGLKDPDQTPVLYAVESLVRPVILDLQAVEKPKDFESELFAKKMLDPENVYMEGKK